MSRHRWTRDASAVAQWAALIALVIASVGVWLAYLFNALALNALR